GAQLAAHLLELGLGVDTAARGDAGCTGGVFQDEALGIFAGLDVAHDVTHGLLGFFGDDARAGHVLAILGVVRDGVVHVGDAALVDQVDDQLEFVQALEVGHFGRVAGVDQSFETRLDQFDRAAAQNGLLAEQVGFGFFAEVGLDDAGAAAAVGHGVGHGQVARLAGNVLMDGDQVGHTAALAVGAANRVARSLGCDHDDVDVGARLDLAVVDVEAVGESQRSAGLQVGFDVVAIDLGD